MRVSREWCELFLGRVGEGLLRESVRAGWVLVAAAVVVVGAGYVWGNQSGDSKGSVWRASADRDVPAPPRTLPWESSPAGRTALNSEPRGESSALSPERLRAAFIPAWDELKRRVQAEATDPTWSPQTEATIERVVAAQLAPEVKVSEVRCGSSACRAKLSHPTSPRIPYAKFVNFTLNRESLGAMEIQLDTRDEGVTTLYFLRNKPRSPQH